MPGCASTWGWRVASPWPSCWSDRWEETVGGHYPDLSHRGRGDHRCHLAYFPVPGRPARAGADVEPRRCTDRAALADSAHRAAVSRRRTRLPLVVSDGGHYSHRRYRYRHGGCHRYSPEHAHTDGRATEHLLYRGHDARPDRTAAGSSDLFRRNGPARGDGPASSGGAL